MDIEQEDVEIRMTILLEYCKRSYEQSDNPNIHFYNIHELKNMDNEIIKLNVIHIINENWVRGGVDDENSHSFPWITRINSKGIELIEKIIEELEKKISELQDGLKSKINTKDKILTLIAFYEKDKKNKIKILEIAGNIIS
ncbi:MAG: hypothetical protein ACRBB2_05775 [Nitrosopumilus sp.]